MIFPVSLAPIGPLLLPEKAQSAAVELSGLSPIHGLLLLFAPGEGGWVGQDGSHEFEDSPDAGHDCGEQENSRKVQQYAFAKDLL